MTTGRAKPSSSEDKREERSEAKRVALLSARFAAHTKKGVSVGIGDDAAVLDAIAAPLVWTIDAHVEGTHFRLDWVTWKDIGFRSFMAAASDLAAMGATPAFALSALTLADSVDDAALDALAEGQAEAAKIVGAPIVGGNLARSANAETSITTTLLGTAERPITRAGARPGDGIYLGGAVGLAGAGLAALTSSPTNANVNMQDARIEACVAAWKRPRALIELGLAMRKEATSAIDISDGLALDASHVAIASGATLVLEQHALLTNAASALLGACELLQRDPLDVILHGGEDYALLVTSRSPIDGFVRIGSVEVGSVEAAGEKSVILVRADGTRVALDPLGFDHFSGSNAGTSGGSASSTATTTTNVNRITMTGH